MPRAELHLLHKMKRLRFVFKTGCIIFGMAVSLEVLATPPTSGEAARRGQSLFARNCAHCHGDDARGDEGPDLHELKKSDARISKIINQGIKGEMPAFGGKFKEEDIQALIAFLRTFKD